MDECLPGCLGFEAHGHGPAAAPGSCRVVANARLLDIKPYVPQYDNYPVQRCGWLDTVPDQPVVADDRFERRDDSIPA